MKYIGAHVSMAGGVFNAPLRAHEIGAKAFAMFSKNQKRWSDKPFSRDDIIQFKENMKKVGISPSNVLVHDSYLINLGHPEKEKQEKSLEAFIDEIKRCEQLGLEKLVFHPGSHLKQITEEECLNNIAKSMNKAIAATKNLTLVIENMAGQGSNLGYKLEHLRHLIDRVENKKRVGVCIDTAHLFESGVDFRTQKQYEEFWNRFDKIVGFKYLKGMHLNDSKTDLGSKVDRHESIGKGHLGLEPFKFLMKDPRLDNIPLTLETIDPSIWKEEIALLYGMTD